MSEQGKGAAGNAGGGGQKAAYKLYDVQVSLERKTATVSINSDNRGMVFVNNFPFDPAGEQSESELKKLAIAEAREILKDAAKAL